jgi:hypothetical protein
MSKKKEVSVVRASAAEYLTFVAAGGNSEASVEMRYEDEYLVDAEDGWPLSMMFRFRLSTST